MLRERMEIDIFSYIIIYLMLIIEDTLRRLGMQQTIKFLYASLRKLQICYLMRERKNS